MTTCNKKDYLLAGNIVLHEIRSRLNDGSIRAHLGVQGLLALLDDKIRRFSAEFDGDELLGMAVDCLVVFAQEAKKSGMLAEEEIQMPPVRPGSSTRCVPVTLDANRQMSRDSENPQQKPELPEIVGKEMPVGAPLTPCPRCDRIDEPEHRVLAGPLTDQLPDPVCVRCEEQMPATGLDEPTAYLAWIQAGDGIAF